MESQPTDRQSGQPVDQHGQAVDQQRQHIDRQSQTPGRADQPQGSDEGPQHKKESVAARVVKFLIPVVVSVGLCVVMFRDIDFNEMLAVIRRDCDFRWIGLMCFMSIFPMVFRGLRWGIQLRAVGIDAPVRVLVYSIFGTYAVNLVFPRLGEVWRTGYVSYRENAPFSTVLGSMIADRFADLLTVLLLTVATFVIARSPLIEFVQTYPDAYRKILHVVSSPWGWIAGTVIIGVCWLVLAKSHNAGVLKVRKFLMGIWHGFAAIGRMKGKFQWLGLTVGIWGCYFLQLEIAFHAFPLTEQLFEQNGLLIVLVCFVLTSISMGIPSNGGIGPYQTTMLFGLGVFMAGANAPAGVSHSEFMTVGAAFGNVIIASQTLLLIVLGLITFALIAIDKHNLRLKKSAVTS